MTETGGGPLRLGRGVCFEQYGNVVYLRHTAVRKDYLFNPIVCDILRCFSGGAVRTAEEVLSALLEQYDVPDGAVFRREIVDFLRLLTAESILTVDAPAASPSLPDVRDQVMEHCMTEKQLFSAALELTYRCNERCLHCYIDDPEAGTGPGELTLAEYRDLLDQLRELGCLNVLLTGGEVLVRSDFLEIAEYAASLGMLVDIFTNGLGLTGDVFDRIKALRPNSLSYSLYGGSARVHDGITQVPGSFERTLRAVMMTKCAGIDTYIKTVVMKQDLDSLEALLQWGRRLGVPVTAGFAVLDTHTGRSARPYQLEDLADFRRALDLLERYQPSGSFAGIKRSPADRVCSAGRCSLGIDPWGEVRPCMSLPVRLGNIRETSLRQIWENAPALEKLRRVTMGDVCGTCGACPDFVYCELCLARVKDGIIPKDVCTLAKAVREGAARRLES